MTALIVVETLLLVLLALLVAGLLRSHAEILRRLEALDESPPAAGSAPAAPRVTAPPRAGAPQAHDLAGVTLRDEPVKIAVRSARTSTLVAFLTSGCATCRQFWDGLQPLVRPAIPGQARLVVVTKDPAFESPSKLRALAPPDVPVVMSSEAWDAYEVPGSPYFVYVDGRSGQIHGEGMAGSWGQVLSLLADALSDADVAAGGDGVRAWGVGRETAGSRVPRTAAERASRAERELATAGIVEGHPSLYTGGDPTRVIGSDPRGS
jgi:hypothetical protein